MNEIHKKQAIKATALELSSMSNKKLRAKVEKLENCDFANIFFRKIRRDCQSSCCQTIKTLFTNYGRKNYIESYSIEEKG